MSHFKWNELSEDWDKTEQYWWILEELIAAVPAGGRAEDYYSAYQKLDKEKKRKIVTVIVLRNKLKFQQSKEINLDEIEVTAEDIKTLVDEYLLEKDKIKIIIENININNDTWN